MKRIFFALLTVVSLTAAAQPASSPRHVSGIVRRYAAAIDACRERLDSLSHGYSASDANRERLDEMHALPDPRYLRLFTPLTFHTDIARRRFSLDASGNDDIDAALTKIYIARPDLVQRFQRDNAAVEPLPAAERKISAPALTESIDLPDIEFRDLPDDGLLITKPNFWTFAGDFYLMVVQNYYSDNWYQGLESNCSWLTKITLQANYNNKQKLTFDNKLEMNLGFQTDRSDDTHKVKTSEDLLRYTGKLGIQATKRWYYTLQLIANTQFLRSFASNSHEVNSAFASPLNVNASVGMSYKFSLAKDRLTGSVYFSPAALGFKYVDRPALAPANGIDEGRHSSADFGYTFTVEGTWNFNDYISWQTRLYGYSPYKRTELQWENTLTVKVSKIIALSIYAYPLFDDSPSIAKDHSFGYFQLKEYTSFGLTYSL